MKSESTVLADFLCSNKERKIY